MVDNEAGKDGMINCMIIQPAFTKNVLTYYGPKVYISQFNVYKKLASLSTICYSFDTQYEADYPNVLDL